MSSHSPAVLLETKTKEAERAAAEKAKEIENFLKDIASILSPERDNYWKTQANKKNELPAGLLNLRKIVSDPKLFNRKTVTDLAELVATLTKSKGVEACLLPLCEIITKANTTNIDMKSQSVLIKLKREIDFSATHSDKKEALSKALSSGDKTAEARAYYELGVLLMKKDLNQYAEQAFEYFTKAINLNSSLEIQAYALRERTSLFGSRETLKGDKLKDLSTAYSLINQVTDFKEQSHVIERGRVLVSYAEELIALKRVEEAIPILRTARKLRPDHDHTILAFLQALHHSKKHDNVLEYIRDVSFDTTSLHGIDFFLQRNGLMPLWLEAARYGDVSLLQYLEPHVERSTRDRDGNTALHYAAEEGHLDLLPILTRYLNVNDQNKQNQTPVMLAAKKGKVAMVMKLLFEDGAAVITDQTDILSVVIGSGQGCVFEAIWESKGYHELLATVGKKYYKAKSTSEPPSQEQLAAVAIGQLYRSAIASKFLSMLKLLIKNHPEGLNTLYNGESSPLHYAIQEKFKEAVYLFVDSGCNLYLENAERETAQQLAKKTDSELDAYIFNSIEKFQKRQKTIGHDIQTFIEQVIQRITDIIPGKSDLKNEENTGRIREALKEVLEAPKYEFLFQKDKEASRQILQDLLVKTFDEKIKSGELIKKRAKVVGLFKDTKYDRVAVLKTVQDTTFCPWDTLATETPEPLPVEIDPKTLSPIAVAFCERFEKQLDKAYGYFSAVSDGDLIPVQDIEDQKKAEMAKQLASHLPTVSVPVVNIPLPVGTIVSGAMDLMLYFRQRYRRKQAERMVSVFKAVTPHQRTHFIRYTAEQLAYKYHDQLHHLTGGSEGIEQFADCAAARVVQYITSDDKHQVAYEPSKFCEAIRIMKSWVLNKEIPPEQRVQKTLYDMFLDGIVRVTSEFPKDMERLQTINDLTLEDNWNSKGIFENTGIVLETGEIYASTNTPLKSYGCCKGTVAEALKRGLTLGPNPSKGIYWGAGRVWETVIHAAPLAPLPILQSAISGASTGKAVLHAYPEAQKGTTTAPAKGPASSSLEIKERKESQGQQTETGKAPNKARVAFV